jgi:hypothetical protein
LGWFSIRGWGWECEIAGVAGVCGSRNASACSFERRMCYRDVGCTPSLHTLFFLQFQVNMRRRKWRRCACFRTFWKVYKGKLWWRGTRTFLVTNDSELSFQKLKQYTAISQHHGSSKRLGEQG